MQKAKRYTSEIASKDPKVCKKFIASELMRKIKINKFTESVKALPYCQHLAETCPAVSSIDGC
jgi:hypothetical protein